MIYKKSVDCQRQNQTKKRQKLVRHKREKQEPTKERSHTTPESKDIEMEDNEKLRSQRIKESERKQEEI